MTKTQDRSATDIRLTTDRLARLTPELLALRDGLAEIATGLVNAYPSETHVLRVTAPLTRASDGLFATIASVVNESGSPPPSAGVEQTRDLTFYEWARGLRFMAATRLWLVPKPGLTGEEHLQLARELVALQAVTSRIAQGLRHAGGDPKTIKAAYSLGGTIADLTVWLGGVAWERQKFPTTYNPYMDPAMYPAGKATATALLRAFTEAFDGTAQETEARR